MKFAGSSPEAALDTLASKKFEKYLDADAKITAPSDYYDSMKTEVKTRIGDLQKQVDTLKSQGKDDLARQNQARQSLVVFLCEMPNEVSREFGLGIFFSIPSIVKSLLMSASPAPYPRPGRYAGRRSPDDSCGKNCI